MGTATIALGKGVFCLTGESLSSSEVGQRIRDRRQALELTQEALARRIRDLTGDVAVNQSWLSKVERGQIADPHGLKMHGLAKALETSVDVFYGGLAEGADAGIKLLDPVEIEVVEAMRRMSQDKRRTVLDVARMALFRVRMMVVRLKAS